MTEEDARDALLDMLGALTNRAPKAGADERAVIAGQIDQINAALDHLAFVGSQEAAASVVAATAQVEALLMTAQLNPFDAAISSEFPALAAKAIQAADQASKPFAANAFQARDEATGDAAPHDIAPEIARAPAPAPVPAAAAAEPPAIVVSSRFADLADEYTKCFAACQIVESRRPAVERSANRLLQGRTRYQAVSRRAGNVPWQLLGIIHGLECGYDFFKHLHNGDSLASPTTHVPEGRPPGWNGSGSWEDSAVDAVVFEKLDKVGTWSLPAVLYALESFNGFGYRTRNVRSPYLWSCSNLYTTGKFVADHKFDPNATSDQVGCAVILKVLEQRGVWP